MPHIRTVSRNLPRTAEQGRINFVEQLVLTVFGLFFSDYSNYPVVIQNLRKFYSKTP